MATTEQEIDSFSEFAKSRLAAGDAVSIDVLFDEWRILHPPADDALAIQASIRDMESGEAGRPFDDFAREFQARNNISDRE